MKIPPIITSALLIGSQLNQKTTAQKLETRPRDHKTLFMNNKGEASTALSTKELKQYVTDELFDYGLNSVKLYQNIMSIMQELLNHLRKTINKISNHRLMVGDNNTPIDIELPPELNEQNLRILIEKVYKSNELEKVRVGTQELGTYVEKSFWSLHNGFKQFIKTIEEKWTTEYIKQTYDLSWLSEVSQELYFDEKSFEFKFHGTSSEIYALTTRLNDLFEDYWSDISEFNAAFEEQSKKLNEDSINFFKHELGLPLSL